MKTQTEIEDALLHLIGKLSGKLPDSQLTILREFIQHGEPGLALETLCSHLVEDDIPVTHEIYSEMKRADDCMNLQIPELNDIKIMNA